VPGAGRAAITLLSPSTADNPVPLFYTPSSLTLTNVYSVISGASTPSVTFDLRYGTDINAAGTLIVTITNNTTNAITNTTTFTNATIPSGNYIWLEVTAVSGVPQEFGATLIY
jgi:hypothetical protein